MPPRIRDLPVTLLDFFFGAGGAMLVVLFLASGVRVGLAELELVVLPACLEVLLDTLLLVSVLLLEETCCSPDIRNIFSSSVRRSNK